MAVESSVRYACLRDTQSASAVRQLSRDSRRLMILASRKESGGEGLEVLRKGAQENSGGVDAKYTSRFSRGVFQAVLAAGRAT